VTARLAGEVAIATVDGGVGVGDGEGDGGQVCRS